MGCLESKEDQEAVRRNAEIDKEMLRVRELDAKTIKLLLLAASQALEMKILHDNGFSQEEINQQKSVVYNNTSSSMAALLRAMNQLSIPLERHEREEDAMLVMEVMRNGDESEPFSPELAAALKTLWRDAGVQEAYVRRNEFQLNDSAKYFLDQVDAIAAPGYSPSTDDMLHTRVKTTGIVEVSYNVKDMDFRVFDVGGQRSERKKWIHCFELPTMRIEDVNAVIFITAMSEYDQVLFEDETTNRMQESIRLFESICNSKWFIKTSMILFFNKKDLFEEKIDRSDITPAFPEFTGPFDMESSAKYIEKKFQSVNDNVEKTIYTHRTCATDTNQVQLVLNSCIDMIISQNLAGSGLY